MRSTVSPVPMVLTTLFLFFYTAVHAQYYGVRHLTDSVTFNITYVSGKITVKANSLPAGMTKESSLSEKIASGQVCEKFVTTEVLQQLSKRLPAMSPSMMVYHANKIAKSVVLLYYNEGLKTLEKVTVKGVGDVSLFLLNGTYTVSIAGMATLLPTDVLIKDNGGYKFDKQALTNYPSALPQILAIAKKYKADFIVPDVYLLPSKKLYIPAVPDSSITLSEKTFTALKGNEVTVSPLPCDHCDKLYLVREEKLESGNDPTQEEVKKTEKKEGPEQLIIPERKFTCDSSFVLAGYTYPPAIQDSFRLVIYTPLAAGREQELKMKNTELEAAFVQSVLQKISSNCRNNVQPAVELYYRDLQAAIGQRASVKKESEIRSEFQKEYEARISQIAGEKGYAAKLTANRRVQVYLSENEIDCSETQRQTLTSGVDLLEVDSIHLEVQNDEVYQIDIVGKMNGEVVKTISNDNYGITLRSLVDGASRISFTHQGQTYWLCYEKVFQVEPPPNGVIKYEIKDGDYVFMPGDPATASQLLEKKQLLDYFSASAFLDVLAFNQNSGNKNLVTELYFNYYVNKMNFYGGLGALKNVYMPVNFGLNLFKQGDGAMETARVSEIMRIDTVGGRRDTLSTHKNYFKNLDLLRHAFMQLNPMVNFVALDNKKLRSIYELNGGFLLMGSNATLLDPSKGVDSIYSKAVYSYSWMLESRIRFIPTSQFGLDLHVGYSFGLRPFNLYMKSVTGNYDVTDLARANMLSENKDDFLKGELNIFFNPHKRPSDTSKGGIYFKLNWFKSVHYADGHFMFLLGYSTDVNNFFR